MAKIQWKLAKGKTWKQKLLQEHPTHGKIVDIPLRMQKRLGQGTMIIPKPLDVDAMMRKAKKGKLITQSQIRVMMAKAKNVTSACPLTTGIFVRIAAEAAEEDRRDGKIRITPYWRTIKDDGKLNEKFPGGAKAQAAKLRAEGFTLLPSKGKQPPRVKGFDAYLVKA